MGIDKSFILEQDVTRGIDILNSRGPSNWPSSVDPNQLDISSGDNCILGQVFGSYNTGREILEMDSISAYDYGFAGIEHEPIWRRHLEELTSPVVESPVRVRELVTA